MSDERRDKEQALLWRGRVDDVRARNSIRTRGAEGNEGKGRAMQNAEQSTVMERKRAARPRAEDEERAARWMHLFISSVSFAAMLGRPSGCGLSFLFSLSLLMKGPLPRTQESLSWP